MRVKEEDIASLATKTETSIPQHWLMYNAVAMKALRNDDQFACAAKRFDMLDRRQCIASLDVQDHCLWRHSQLD